MKLMAGIKHKDMEKIKERFHLYETRASFKLHKKQGLISPDSICFIDETRQIYTQGKYYSPCWTEYEDLKKTVLNHDAQIKNIIGIEGPSVRDGIINNIADLVDFLDGFKEGDNLKDYINSRSQGFDSNKLTEEEILALEKMEPGDIVYDITNNKYVYYNGSTWMNFSDSLWQEI